MLLSGFLSKATIDWNMSPSTARETWLAYRLENGFRSERPLLTAPSENRKLEKSGKVAVLYGLSLAPARLSGHNVCPFSTPECRRGCVSFAGHGRWDSVTKARVTKTRFLQADPSAFLVLLRQEITRAHDRFGDDLAVRLNTFSDIPWEQLFPELLADLRGVRLYDYTKHWSRQSTDAYHLTFSASEKTTDTQIIDKVSEGHNVAVVFDTTRTKPLAETYLGIPVIDGDVTDVRDRDPKGVIVGLRAKGRMRTGNWAMVRAAGG